MTTLVFYQHFGAEPYFNMAFDEWLLARASESPDRLFARLYTWRVGTITFGFNQRQETALDFAKVGTTPVVRRITGGRALYHDRSELTYAVAMHVGSSSTNSISKTSASIAEALRRFLSCEGVLTQYVRVSHAQNSRPEYFHKAPCFASVARYELLQGDQKIIASAQRRVGGCVFQHGAIKLRGVASHPALALSDTALIKNPQPIEANAFSAHATHFVESFAESYELSSSPGNLADEEIAEVQQWTDFVKKNPLTQRQIIKRKPRHDSQ